MAGKISYSPFKMQGSWVGAGIYALISILIMIYSRSVFFFSNGLIEARGISYLTHFPTLLFQKLIGSLVSQSDFGYSLLLVFPLFYILWSLILGFLLGWGIHSLVRYLRNRNN